MPRTPDDRRWDGWDVPDYQPTEDELNEPVVIDAPTPESLGEALMRHKPRRKNR
ncbi:MAG: hypothetical protein OXH67_10385 [Acidimicrobiaceae bacterium]|nr:hypothetical protein [Acidimicrobiaceae bacterium]MDE0665988.1 hypothetical protein [Acidimicrobiaceae bacterium]